MSAQTADEVTLPETSYWRAIRQAREQFDGFIGDHQMTVLMDRLESGDMEPYRHIRFSAPGTSIYRFDLVTWPGHLSISGDLSSFTFRRLHDMFDFFRGPADDLRINPSYWGEKVIAGDRGTDLGRTRYSREAFIEQVECAVEDAADDYSEADFEALKQAVQEELLDDAPEYIEEAYERAQDFRWSPPGSSSKGLYSVSGSEFRFSDTWEWDLTGYDHHFLLACHAIQWGIRTYLAEYPDRLVHEVPRDRTRTQDAARSAVRKTGRPVVDATITGGVL